MLHGPVAAAIQHVGDRLVHLAGLVVGEPLRRRLPHTIVYEGVALLLDALHEGRALGLLEQRLRAIRRRAHRLRERGGLEAHAQQRGRADEPSRIGAQRVEALHHEMDDVSGQHLLGERLGQEHPRRAGGPHEPLLEQHARVLTDGERVPARDLRDATHDGVVERAAPEERCDQATDGLAIERLERDAAQALRADRIDECLTSLVALGVTARRGGHQQRRRLIQARHQVEDLPRPAVDPLNVVDHEDGGAAVDREVDEEPEQRLVERPLLRFRARGLRLRGVAEQLRKPVREALQIPCGVARRAHHAARPRLARRRLHPADPGGEVVARLSECAVRDRRQLLALAREHERGFAARRLEDLAHEAALAEPALPLDLGEGQAAARRLGPEPAHLRKRRVASDERHLLREQDRRVVAAERGVVVLQTREVVEVPQQPRRALVSVVGIFGEQAGDHRRQARAHARLRRADVRGRLRRERLQELADRPRLKRW